ncbi:MAG: hypothetical protein OEZ06_12250 [Myxococcales bacterium]|nr:hypothetical protein [Myxococcales bacterium]
MIARHARPCRLGCSLLLLLALLGCGGGEPSDEDRIERILQDITGKVDDSYVPRCLSHVDMEAVPIDVKAPQYSGVYHADRAPELEKGFRRVIARHFAGTEIKLRGHTIELEGDPARKAEVSMGLMTAVGPLKVELSLEKTTPTAWKVARVHIRRGF